jgi:hypothetical protein
MAGERERAQRFYVLARGNHFFEDCGTNRLEAVAAGAKLRVFLDWHGQHRGSVGGFSLRLPTGSNQPILSDGRLFDIPDAVVPSKTRHNFRRVRKIKTGATVGLGSLTPP